MLPACSVMVGIPASIAKRFGQPRRRSFAPHDKGLPTVASEQLGGPQTITVTDRDCSDFRGLGDSGSLRYTLAHAKPASTDSRNALT